MEVSVSVPKVEALDLRPEAPPGQAHVIGSGHKASFLMLQARGLQWIAVIGSGLRGSSVLAWRCACAAGRSEAEYWDVGLGLQHAQMVGR